MPVQKLPGKTRVQLLDLGLDLVPTRPDPDAVTPRRLASIRGPFVLLAERNSEQRPVRVERERRDRRRVLGQLAQSLLGDRVPQRDGRVASARRKRAVPAAASRTYQ